MKKTLLLIVALSSALNAGATIPKKIHVPDIPGYITLKGDFHIHTVFSDGDVWPVTRVAEAAYEGLDFISITDHIDSNLLDNTNNGLFNCDRDESWRIAASSAKYSGLIVLHGGELSRGMPPGHLNAHFVNDNDAIASASENKKNTTNQMMAIDGLTEARRQGAFITWNHPGWEKHAPNETVWYPEHTELYEKGLIDGIEIYNHDCKGIDPEAFHWAIEKNLAIVSGTDAHDAMFQYIDYALGEHRPVTLVFAKERSEKGIREALDARKSAVFADGKVYGNENLLKPLCDEILKYEILLRNEKRIYLRITNNSSIPLVLSKAGGSEELVYRRYFVINEGEEMELLIRGVNGADLPEEVSVNFNVENFWIDADTTLKYELNFAPAR